jgi:5'(3')-deoxyribonucleotidase
MSYPPLFVDLDEVITDFVGAALKLHGWDRPLLEKYRTPGSWDISVPMRLSDEEFWKPIHRAGEDFWINIQPLPWAADFVAYLARHDWTIVTAPSRDVSSYSGKAKWISRNLPAMLSRTIINKDKHWLGHIPGAILIDDREANLEKFAQVGGRTILFPNRGNQLYKLADDPLPHVLQVLEGMLCQ